MPPTKPKPSPTTLIKPRLDTRFHIDYEWWERNDVDLRAYLLSHLPPHKREQILLEEEGHMIDHVDPETGEVHRMDSLGVALQEAAKEPDFINPQTSLVDSVFRIFLINGNKPLSPNELADVLSRDASTILKTLGGLRIYRGLRPVDQ